MDSDIVRLLLHRIRTHKAALAMDDKLGHPLVLDDAVVDTRARLAEAETILYLVRESEAKTPGEGRRS